MEAKSADTEVSILTGERKQFGDDGDGIDVNRSTHQPAFPYAVSKNGEAVSPGAALCAARDHVAAVSAATAVVFDEAYAWAMGVKERSWMTDADVVADGGVVHVVARV